MNRLNTVTTRMGPDLRDAIEAMPGLGGVALWVKFLDSEDPRLIARTDGVYVEAGPRYEEYDDAERRFIVLHELLHVALAHPAREREMKRRTEDFDSRLYNIACDAIINAALDGARSVRSPDIAVTLEKLLAPLGHWGKDDKPAEVVVLLEGKICRAWNDNFAALRSETLSHDHTVEVDAGEFESYPGSGGKLVKGVDGSEKISMNENNSRCSPPAKN